ncbi:MAG: hypothetical protein RL268_87 [Pseudomonadota bacterium]
MFGVVEVGDGRVDRVTPHFQSIQVGACDGAVTLAYVETGRESVVFTLDREQCASHIAALSQACQQAFGGADVQRDRISVRTSLPVQAETRLEITLSELGGWLVKASHPFGHAFTGHFRTDAEVQQHIGDWLAELRIEAALGRNETMEETRARVQSMVTL